MKDKDKENELVEKPVKVAVKEKEPEISLTSFAIISGIVSRRALYHTLKNMAGGEKVTKTKAEWMKLLGSISKK